MGGVNNHFMDDILSKLSYYYEGTFACDEVLDFIPKCHRGSPLKSSIVVNTLPSHLRSDGHYFAICHNKLQKSVFLFDPLGLEHQDPNINAYIKKIVRLTGWTIIPSPIPIQAYGSISCGLMVISFILQHDMENSSFRPLTFVNHFTYPPTLENDTIACNLILKYISRL